MIKLYIVIYRAKYLDGDEYELIAAFLSHKNALDFVSNSTPADGYQYEYEIKSVEWELT